MKTSIFRPLCPSLALTLPLSCALVLLLCGCGSGCPGSGNGLGSTCGQSNTTATTATTSATVDAPTDGGTGQLYVSSATNNSIYSYAGATALNGDLAPSGIITGSSTQLDSPGRLLSDPTNNTLYVANAGNSSILVFSNVSTATGNAVPTRVLGGTGTELNSPVALAIDGNHNILYVANGNQSIEAFNDASTVTGVVAPARVIAGTDTGFSSVSSLVYDGTNDVLYVIDSGADAIYAFNAASNVTGNAYPNRKIVGTATELSNPQDAILVGTNMIVSNGSGAILRFASILSLNGSIVPTAVISGTATDLVTPQQLAYDSTIDGLFVNDPGDASVLVFEGISTATGAPGPNLTLSGSATALGGQSGMAVDFTQP